MPPRDPRFLCMEEWEFELDYHTHMAYEKAILKAKGVDVSSEEYEVSDEDFKSDLESFMNNGDTGKLSPDVWEEVK